jgi:hypothetical protein
MMHVQEKTRNWQAPPTTMVALDPGIVQPLRREAARRDVSLQHLVTSLLGVIVEDQLTTAILDDFPGVAACDRGHGNGPGP